jgi:hypothetical protein
LLGEILFPSPLSLPLVVAGAGPGLEEAMPLLKEGRWKGRMLILAVSSAVPAMDSRGLMPDLVVSTDGGNWARLHLNECWRRIFSGETGWLCAGLAAALTAVLPSQCAGIPILPINDGSLWQRIVLSGLGIPSLALPQRGTVSASALDLAFYLSCGKIYLCGLDLALKDIRSHARPYSFDALWEKNEGRLHPVYSQNFARALALRAGGSHGIYASWFGRQLGAWPKRIFSLGKNHPVFEGISSPDFERELGLPQKGPGRDRKLFETLHLKKTMNSSINDSIDFSKQAALLLKSALRDDRYAGKISEELRELLFPGPGSVPAGDLEEAALSLACPRRRYE